MLLDWFLYGLVIFGAAKLLNITAFKRRPASQVSAWSLTIVVFAINLFVLTVVKLARYQTISESVGVQVNPQNPLDLVGAVIFAWLFFSLLNTKAKQEASDDVGGEQPLEADGFGKTLDEAPNLSYACGDADRPERAQIDGLSKDEIEYLKWPILSIDYMAKYRVSEDQLLQALREREIRFVQKDGVIWVQDSSIY
jgi:hypothetical protein